MQVVDAALVRVLVVDDHTMFAEAVARSIESELDLELAGAVTTIEAAEAVLTSGRVDAVVLDIELNGESGIDLLRNWSSRLPDCSFVLLATSVRRESVLEALECGAAAVISKSRPADDLIAAVRAARNGRLSILLETAADDDQISELGLTDREVGILRLLAEGQADSEIAEALHISRNTVRTHVRRAFAKLGASSRLEAVAVARRHGVL